MMTLENAAASHRRSGPVPALDLFGKHGQQAVDGWLRSSNAALDGSLALMADWMAFGRNRMDEDAAAFRTFSECKDFGEVTECQRQFAEIALKEYTEQFTKMGDQIRKILTGFAPIQPAELPPAKSH